MVLEIADGWPNLGLVTPLWNHTTTGPLLSPRMEYSISLDDWQVDFGHWPISFNASKIAASVTFQIAATIGSEVASQVESEVAFLVAILVSFLVAFLVSSLVAVSVADLTFILETFQ